MKKIIGNQKFVFTTLEGLTFFWKHPDQSVADLVRENSGYKNVTGKGTCTISSVMYFTTKLKVLRK
jgi:hypothetical protein